MPASLLLKFIKSLMAMSTALLPASFPAVAVITAVGTTAAVTAGCAAPDDGDDDDGGNDDDGGDDD